MERRDGLGPMGMAPWGKLTFHGSVGGRRAGSLPAAVALKQPGADFRWPAGVAFLGDDCSVYVPLRGDAWGVCFRVGDWSRAYTEFDIPCPSKIGRKLYVLKPVGPDAKPRLLVDAGRGAIGSPSVSYDGQSIYVAMARDGESFFHIYRVPVDGGTPEQLDRRAVSRHRSGRAARRADRLHLDAHRQLRGIPQSSVAGAVRDEGGRQRHRADHVHAHLRQRAQGDGRRPHRVHSHRQLLRPRQGGDADPRDPPGRLGRPDGDRRGRGGRLRRATASARLRQPGTAARREAGLHFQPRQFHLHARQCASRLPSPARRVGRPGTAARRTTAGHRVATGCVTG